MIRRLTLALLLGSTGCSMSTEGIASDPNPLDDSASSDDSSSTDDAATDSTADPDTTIESDSAGDDTSTSTDGAPTDTGSDDSSLPDTSSGDTGAMDTGAGDTSADDTGTGDTGAPDTGAPDTGTPDTATPDTGTPDTGTPDTGTPDTGPTDTGVTDTAPETPPTGVLTVTSGELTSGLSINLATEGTIDWAHWGYSNADRWNHKSTGTALVKGTLGSGFGGSPNHFGSYPTRFSWTGGSPDASVTNTADGIYHDANGESFTFSSAGDATTARTLRVYGSWRNQLVTNAKTSGTIDVSLDDSSATAWKGNIPPPGGADANENRIFWVNINYRPVAATGRVVVKITQTSGNGYISLLAATLK